MGEAKRTNVLRLTVGVVAVAAVVGIIAYGLLRSSESGSAVDAEGRTVATGPIDTPGSSPRERSVAPDFVLADYDGHAVQLSDFRGKTVLLNFWATWCTTCAAEMPDMQRLAEENRADLVVLAVNQAEPAGRAQSWSDARGLTALTFALDRNEDVTDAYKLPSGLPHSFFIDASGIIREVKHGGMDYEEMKRLLEETRAAAP